MTENVDATNPGEEPIADNTETQEEQAFHHDAQQDTAFQELTAEFIVRKHVAYAAGSGLIPIPLFDIAAVTAVQIKMVRDLSRLYGIPFSENRLKTIITALIGGIGSEQIGRRVLGSFLKSIPVIGQVAGAASVPLMAGATTYAVGQVFRKHFASGGNLINFDPAKAKDYFNQQYQRGRDKVSEMTGAAKKGTEPEAGAEPQPA